MTDINNLLSPEQIEALERVKTNLKAGVDVTPQPKAILGKACGAVRCKAECEGFLPSGTVQDGFKLCACSHSEQTHTGVRAEPEPSLADMPVTVINGVEIDLRSEGWIETNCADCQSPLMVEIAPEGVDLAILTAMPRTAVCQACALVRTNGKQGIVIHDARVEKPEWKEEPVLNLSNFTNAELAEAAGKARDLMEAEEALALAERREQAIREKAEREARDKAQLKADRAEQSLHKKWMGGFAVNGKKVPALDFTEVNLDEAVSRDERSPYNKVLHSLGETLLSPDVTYAEVRKLHKRLFKDAPEQERLVAVVEPDAKAKVAKVEAFAKVTGKTYDEALEHLVRVGVV